MNQAPKIPNARGTAAAQNVSGDGFVGINDFSATVDFSPRHVIVPGSTGFPPALAQPGTVGEPMYSPLIQLPDGAVVHAPQIANETGPADKRSASIYDRMTVTHVETTGLYDGTPVHDASFDSHSPVATAIEDFTYAPALNAAPRPGDESDGTSAREGLIAFTNGHQRSQLAGPQCRAADGSATQQGAAQHSARGA